VKTNRSISGKFEGGKVQKHVRSLLKGGGKRIKKGLPFSVSSSEGVGYVQKLGGKGGDREIWGRGGERKEV